MAASVTLPSPCPFFQIRVWMTGRESKAFQSDTSYPPFCRLDRAGLEAKGPTGPGRYPPKGTKLRERHCTRGHGRRQAEASFNILGPSSPGVYCPGPSNPGLLAEGVRMEDSMHPTPWNLFPRGKVPRSPRYRFLRPVGKGDVRDGCRPGSASRAEITGQVCWLR